MLAQSGDGLMLVAHWQCLRQPLPLQLHKEMQQSLAQLRQIQSELRSGMNVMDPGWAPSAVPMCNPTHTWTMQG